MRINKSLFDELARALESNECDSCKLLSVKMYVAAIIADYYANEPSATTDDL
jgi:hypothetical protein